MWDVISAVRMRQYNYDMEMMLKRGKVEQTGAYLASMARLITSLKSIIETVLKYVCHAVLLELEGPTLYLKVR